MRYTFHHWNILINQELNPASTAGFPSGESIEKILVQSAEEQKSVRNLILKNILERNKIRDKKQYIQLLQIMLGTLMDRLISYKSLPGCNLTMVSVYNQIMQHLESVMDFLRCTFPDYFDYDQKAPLEVRCVSIGEIQKQIPLLEERGKNASPACCEVIRILLNNLDKFCRVKKQSATYNELCYQKDLLDHLLREKAWLSESAVNETLFYVNYNHEEYLQHLCKKLKAVTLNQKDARQKIAALLLERKKINQLPVKLHCRLSSEVPSLKDQVNSWIENEINFLERDGTGTDPVHEEVFVHVPFKGTEIYLLHKAFIDSGGAVGETYKSLFEKTAAHLINKNQKGFSIESLQKNSDKVNYEVKDDVKRFLQKMIRNIDSY